jgi:hypothetical protein
MVNELIAKTLVKNLEAKEREIPWAGISLKPGESRLVDGLFPSACKTPAEQALMMAEIDAGKVEVTLITNLTCAGIDSFVAARAGAGKYAGKLTGTVQRQELPQVSRRQERLEAEAALLAREADSRSQIPPPPIAGAEIPPDQMPGAPPAAPEEKPARTAAEMQGRMEESAPQPTETAEQILAKRETERTERQKQRQSAQAIQRGSLKEHEAEQRRQLMPDTVIPAKPAIRDALARTPKDATAEAKGASLTIADDARQLATQLGLTANELAFIRGTGRNNRIVAQDIKEYAAKKGVKV